MAEHGEQLFDRLANCEYPGVPRWLWEPYVKEFVNMPHQSWMMNDFMNETRRVYIGAEHINSESQHSLPVTPSGSGTAPNLLSGQNG